MKIRMIDYDNKMGQCELFVTREPKQHEHLYLRNGSKVVVLNIYQFLRNTKDNFAEEPDLVAIVKYQENGNPALTDFRNEFERQRALDILRQVGEVEKEDN
ncbi:hypothetical protein [Lactiplantibacillus pentosus]|uniref:hypothetical protein n=1 Tax=Lactiplantibacillus pentosus TaxID=1589 RepID=UPI001CFFE35B|nr:hypothetical protein [Lactiplantibacillus pentosus]MCB5220293.1 hypothetical protein [Lactiplantibacillus pentosus]